LTASFRLYILMIVEISDGFSMDASQAIAGLAALAHDTRLAAFRLLVQRGPEGLPAGVIAQSLGLPPSSLRSCTQINRC
jgi:DNA-binding transcriptional ArsR family regulator